MKLEAKDLRIGNAVYYADEVVSIAAILMPERDIYDFEIRHSDDMFSQVQDDIEPILLNKEWLVRMGFEK